MKSLNRASVGAFFLFAAFGLFSSCKKEATPITPPDELSSMAVVNNSCKPVVLGATVQDPGGPLNWVTFMQKWYGTDGKLAFLKANFFAEMHDFTSPENSIPWGQLSYYNDNQVYLISGGDTTMRVTVDAQQRPEASYYHHNTLPTGTFLIDTSYYHWTGNRLDSIINLYVHTLGGHSEFAKYIFFYDGFGNVVRVDRWDPAFNVTSMFLSYDYGEPVQDMVSMHQISIPYKLMEYMDLLRFPIHHKVIGVSGFHNDWQYNTYGLLGGGLVFSYHAAGINQRIFYTGWDCGGSPTSAGDLNRQRNNLNSLEDFKKLYPQH